MAEKIKVWFDAEADFFEVRFSVLGACRFSKSHPLEADLLPVIP